MVMMMMIVKEYKMNGFYICLFFSLLCLLSQLAEISIAFLILNFASDTFDRVVLF